MERLREEARRENENKSDEILMSDLSNSSVSLDSSEKSNKNRKRKVPKRNDVAESRLNKF